MVLGYIRHSRELNTRFRNFRVCLGAQSDARLRSATGQERPLGSLGGWFGKFWKRYCDMTGAAKKRWFWLAECGLILVVVYSGLGILQALFLFQGERVLVNLRLWGSIMLLSVIGASVCFFLAAYCGKRSTPSPPPDEDF